MSLSKRPHRIRTKMAKPTQLLDRGRATAIMAGVPQRVFSTASAERGLPASNALWTEFVKLESFVIRRHVERDRAREKRFDSIPVSRTLN
jgi:hypothetical protein